MTTLTRTLTGEQHVALLAGLDYVAHHKDIEIRQGFAEHRLSLEVKYAKTEAEPETEIFARMNAVCDMADDWAKPWPGFFDDGKFGFTLDDVVIWTWAR